MVLQPPHFVGVSTLACTLQSPHLAVKWSCTRLHHPRVNGDQPSTRIEEAQPVPTTESITPPALGVYSQGGVAERASKVYEQVRTS